MMIKDLFMELLFFFFLPRLPSLGVLTREGVGYDFSQACSALVGIRFFQGVFFFFPYKRSRVNSQQGKHSFP